MWIPEVARCLALAGVEVLLHPTSWGTEHDAHVCCVERCSENRVHIVSANRLDSSARVGSQVCFAGEFLGDEPIPLMRFPAVHLSRYGVEEQLHVTLERREAHCKMMGFFLDVLAKRFPETYRPLVTPSKDNQTCGFWWQADEA